jgi:hypothetical protein
LLGVDVAGFLVLAGLREDVVVLFRLSTEWSRSRTLRLSCSIETATCEKLVTGLDRSPSMMLRAADEESRCRGVPSSSRVTGTETARRANSPSKKKLNGEKRILSREDGNEINLDGFRLEERDQ